MSGIEVAIVGAIIGAGVGGVVSAHKSGSPWLGALLGAAGGAATGYGLGAAGVGAGMAGGATSMAEIGAAGAMQGGMGAGAAGSVGSTAYGLGGAASGLGVAGSNLGTLATDAGAIGMAPATAASLSSAPTTASGLAPAAVSAGWGSDLLTAGMSGLSTVSSMINQPSYPDPLPPIAPETIQVEDPGPTLRERTAAEIAELNAKKAALAKRYSMGEGAQSVGALQSLRDAYVDPRAYLRQPRNALSSLAGVSSTPGGAFRFGTA